MRAGEVAEGVAAHAELDGRGLAGFGARLGRRGRQRDRRDGGEPMRERSEAKSTASTDSIENYPSKRQSHHAFSSRQLISKKRPSLVHIEADG